MIEAGKGFSCGFWARGWGFGRFRANSPSAASRRITRSRVSPPVPAIA